MKYWELYGSNVRDGKTYFKVYAPNASSVKMNNLDMSKSEDGSWQLELGEDLTNLTYSYQITDSSGKTIIKADPVSKANSIHPNRNSIVYSSRHDWQDARWLSARASFNFETEPMAIYEIHLNSWMKGLTYRQLADRLPEYLNILNFNYVQFMPIADYPFTPSWGYQITGFYAPSAFFGSPDDLKYLIDTLHQNNIGVILDWVGYHFPKDDFALAKYDGTNLYETLDDPDSTDWGTCLFDYSKPHVQEFMLSNLRYWVEEFHIDGFRIDAVAQMTDKALRSLPADWDGPPPTPDFDESAIAFIKEVNKTLKNDYPGVFSIAEDSGNMPNLTNKEGLDFNFKFHMHASWEWILHYLQPKHPINGVNYERVFSLIKDSKHEKHVWEISHDVVHHACNNCIFTSAGIDEHLAIKAFMVYMMMLISAPGKFMMFMGTELASTLPWEPEGELDWSSSNRHTYFTFLSEALERYRNMPEFYAEDYTSGGFAPIRTEEAAGVFGFYRVADGRKTICLYNFSGESQITHLPESVDIIFGTSKECIIDTTNNTVTLSPYSGVWLKPQNK
jgi:1,4-alpha-glucan branching enzyme